MKKIINTSSGLEKRVFTETFKAVIDWPINISELESYQTNLFYKTADILPMFGTDNIYEKKVLKLLEDCGIISAKLEQESNKDRVKKGAFQLKVSQKKGIEVHSKIVIEIDKHLCDYLGELEIRLIEKGSNMYPKKFWVLSSGYSYQYRAAIFKFIFKTNNSDKIDELERLTMCKTPYGMILAKVKTKTAKQFLELYQNNFEVKTNLSEELNNNELLVSVNATTIKNIACYINHSENPNCGKKLVKRKSGGIFKAIIALREIQPGEEITIDYGEHAESIFRNDQELLKISNRFRCKEMKENKDAN